MFIADRFEKNAYIKNNNMQGIPLVSVLFVVFLLASCGFVGTNNSPIDDRSSRTVSMDSDVSLDELRDLARPPGIDGSVETSGVRTMSGGFKDINSKKLLFDEKIRDKNDRLDRIESAVQNLSDNFNNVSPAIKRLVEIENDLRELHNQLSLLINGTGDDLDVANDNFVVVAPDIAPTPVMVKKAPSAPKPITPPKPIAVKKSNIRVSASLPNIRVADYPDKTRIVFETATKKLFTHNFDQDNQLLVINSPIAFSQSILNKLNTSSKYIVGVSATDGGNGTDIAIMTKGMNVAGKGAYIGATSSNRNYRYYIDIKK